MQFSFPKILHSILAILIFYALFFGQLHAVVLLNQPQVGQKLEVLIENESLPANATLVDPDGNRIELVFENGQASHLVDKAGRWKLILGSNQMVVEVKEEIISSNFEAGSNQSEAGFGVDLGIAAAFGAIFVLLALAAIAIYYLVFKPPLPKSPSLERKISGNKIFVRFYAGTKPLKNVVLQDVLEQGGATPKKLECPSLAAFQNLEISYEAENAQTAGEAKASFELDSKACELSVREGVAVFSESKEAELAFPLEQESKKSEESPQVSGQKKAPRKLSRL